MEIRVVLDYDEDLNILFSEDFGDIRTEEDVIRLFDQYSEYFKKLGKKVYLVSNIDNLRVHADVANFYGETVKKAVHDSIAGFARWGSNDWARMTVRTTSLKANIPANIFEDREQAVAAIETLRA